MAVGGRATTSKSKITKTKNLMWELTFWMKVNPYTMKVMHRKINDKKKG
jgi:hypothetical protein